MKKGFLCLPVSEVQGAKMKASKILGASNRTCLSRKINHYRDMPHHVYTAINEMFGTYGITEERIWTIKKIRK
jgi:inorganic pyrophosphatase